MRPNLFLVDSIIFPVVVAVLLAMVLVFSWPQSKETWIDYDLLLTVG